MEKITMFDRTLRVDVDVYKFSSDNKTALCWNPALAAKQSGNGWIEMSRKRLIPYPYAEMFKMGIESKTELNKIKERLTLSDAIWTTTDGQQFSHKDLNVAIRHQKRLLEEENK